MGPPYCGRPLGSLQGACGPEDMQVVQKTFEEVEGRTEQKGLLASGDRKADKRGQCENISKDIISFSSRLKLLLIIGLKTKENKQHID